MEQIIRKVFFTIKKINKYHIIALVVIVIVLSTVLNLLTPKLPNKELVIETNSSQTQSAIISFSEDLRIVIPKQLTVYSSESSQQSLSSFAEKLAESIQYTKSNSSDTVWTNENKTSSLKVEPLTNTVEFKNYFSPFDLEEIENTINKDEAKSIYNDFLQKYLPEVSENYNFTLEQPVFISNEEMEYVEEESANAYNFEVNKLLDELPYIVGTRRVPFSSGIILASGEIMEINFYPFSESFTKIQTHPSLELADIQSNTQNGLVSFILVSSQNIYDYSSENLQTIHFTQALLEYRKNELNGYILPYVRFIGTGTDNEGKTYSVEAISPAIDVE